MMELPKDGFVKESYNREDISFKDAIERFLEFI